MKEKQVSTMSSNWLKAVRSILEQTGDLEFDGTLQGDGFEVKIALTVKAPGDQPSISASGMATWSG